MKAMSNLVMVPLIILFFYSPISAQNNEQVYYQVDYMKVKPSDHRDYRAMEAVWKKLHQANVNAGMYTSWTLEFVRGSGTNSEYNYLTRIRFEDEKQLAAHMSSNVMMENMETVLSEEDLKIVQNTNKLRDYVKSEIWSLSDILTSDRMQNAKYSFFNFFDFPEDMGRSDFNEVQALWKPVHQARVDDNKMAGWVNLSLTQPYGSANAYHTATVDVYENLENYFANDPRPYFEKLMPDMKLEEIGKKTWESTDLIRGELRIRLNTTN